MVQTSTFDAFGNLTASSGSAANSYQFQTKELHATSGLVYFGARWYDPSIGRWTTPDPLGMVDGPNRYLYLQNSPLNALDPWGLCGGVGGFGGGFWGGFWSGAGTAIGLQIGRAVGRQIGGSVGAAIGGYFGGPAGAYQGYWIGGGIGEAYGGVLGSGIGRAIAS